LQTFEQERSVILDVSNLQPSNNKSSIHVLNVDDAPAILEISKLMLIDLGNFEIDNACYVDEAFEKIRNHQYDAIVSDYEMPQKNGLTFLKEIREQKNEIPFILFTGKGREEIEVHDVLSDSQVLTWLVHKRVRFENNYTMRFTYRPLM
jgi:CheY-like chemotaxis protein